MDNTQSKEDLIARFISSNDEYTAAAEGLIAIFGGGEDALTDDARLIISFKRNLALLVQKTWVEKDDVALKDSVLYRLEKFRATNALWQESYEPFLSLIRDAVYLMFGDDAGKDDFGEYAMRIDPEFGMFWHFICCLSDVKEWSEDKYHKAIDCGMSFLANY